MPQIRPHRPQPLLRQCPLQLLALLPLFRLLHLLHQQQNLRLQVFLISDQSRFKFINIPISCPWQPVALFHGLL